MPKILIVEDDRMIRHLLARRLTQAGHAVVVAGDGEEGIRLAQSELPDLIMMDIGLPKLNGWQATQRIRSIWTTRAIPIIAVTAYAMQQDRERCMIAGCNEYETKPINFGRLFEKIDALVVVQPIGERPYEQAVLYPQGLDGASLEFESRVGDVVQPVGARTEP